MKGKYGKKKSKVIAKFLKNYNAHKLHGIQYTRAFIKIYKGEI